jgi:Uma2 family endonuclease
MPPIAATSPPPSEKRLMTVEEFWDFGLLDENKNRDFELIRGEVVELSRPNYLHGRACARFTHILETWSEPRGKGEVIGNDSGVILEYDPATVVGPDVAYYELTETPEKWSDVPPILAVEVLSPNDRNAEVKDKVKLYLDSGTKLVWVVDPEKQTVTVHRPKSKPEVIPNSGELDGGDDLPGFRSPVSAFFPKPKQ